METIPLYLIKVVFSLAVLFGYYHLFLRDKTFHHYNRFYLLSAVVISLLLPLLKVSYFTIELNNNFYLLLSTFQNNETIKNTNNDYLYFTIAYSVFGLVAVVLLIKILAGILKIESFKKQFPKEKIEGISFYQTNLEDAPFSYFRNLFWKNSIILQSDLGRQILKHEMIHIEQKHSFDKIMMELVTAIFWFNPFFWFIKKEINLIHEYLADKKAVKQSDTQAFAQMLLASHFASTSLPGTSPFLSSNLKKRLKMLQKSKTKYSYARKILALPLLFAIGFAYLVKAENKEIIETNKAIKKEISKITKDTTKVSANLIEVNSKGLDPNVIHAQKAPENALFLIQNKEVSKEKYLKYLMLNIGKNKTSTAFFDETKSDPQNRIFGDRGKYGVFRIFFLDPNIENNKKELYKLVKKYNPNWFKNIKNNEMSKSDSQFKGINKSDKILNPNNKEITKLDFGNVLEDAPYISESVKVVIQNNFNEMFSKTQSDKNNYSVKYISENKNNRANTKNTYNEEFEKDLDLIFRLNDSIQKMNKEAKIDNLSLKKKFTDGNQYEIIIKNKNTKKSSIDELNALPSSVYFNQLKNTKKISKEIFYSQNKIKDEDVSEDNFSIAAGYLHNNLAKSTITAKDVKSFYLSADNNFKIYLDDKLVAYNDLDGLKFDEIKSLKMFLPKNKSEKVIEIKTK